MELNKNQQEAVLHLNGPCLVLAGPGSGKTRVIAHRIVHMIQNENIPPTRILAISFTKASSVDMKSRTLDLGRDERIKKVNFGTFHSTFFRILRRYANVNIEDIISEIDRLKLTKSIVKHLNIKNYSDEDIIDVLSEISYVKNEMINPIEYSSKIFSEDEFQDIFRLYEKAKINANKIDFDDMLVMAYKLLKDNEEVLHIVRSVFKYILIDEFQDINRVQFEVIRLIATPTNNVFVVGDEDQSIYGFRGARPDFMIDFEKFFKGAKKIVLDTNYRTKKNIVNLSQKLIKNNKNRYDKTVVPFSQDDGSIRFITPKDCDDEAKYIAEEIKKEVESNKGGDYGNKVNTNSEKVCKTIVNKANIDIEKGNRYSIDKVNSDIENGCRYGSIKFKDNSEPVYENDRNIVDTNGELDSKIVNSSYKDYAIIYRTNRQARAFVDVFMDLRIPFILKDTPKSLYDHWVCVDLISYLKIAVRIGTNDDWYRIINRPFRYISRENIKIAMKSEDFFTSLMENDSIKKFQKNNLEDLYTDLEYVRSLKPEYAISYVRSTLDYDRYILEYCHERKIKAKQIIDVLDEFENTSKSYKTIFDFFKHIEEVKEEIRKRSDKNYKTLSDIDSEGVVLTTMHSSKGLEFDNVYIIGVNDTVIPFISQEDEEVEDPNYEEERRLLYVGITRAKNRVVISSPMKRFSKSIDKSRFLKEIE